MIRLVALAAVAAAFVVAAAGCGGSSSNSSSGATTTAASGGTDTTSSSTDTTTTDTTSSSTDTTNTDTSSGTDTTSSSATSSGALKGKCLDFAGATAKISQAIAASSTGGGDTKALRAYFAALADKAPSNVKAAFQTLGDAVGDYLDALKKAGFKPGQTPSAADIQKLQAAVAPLSTPEVKQASDEVQAWVNGGCKS